jgi:MFS family permease
MSENTDPQKPVVESSPISGSAPAEAEFQRVPGTTMTQVIMNSANIIDNADAQLFPNVFNQVQTDFASHGVTITIGQLGWIVTIRSLLQAVTTPMWGWWNDRHSRKKVLAFGCILWGVATILMATSMSFVELLVYRSVTGVGLAVIIPTTQSVVADLIPPAYRGRAFGWLAFTQVIGVIAGTLFATELVNSVPSNWRLVFYIWGVISIGIGLAIYFFATDPVRGLSDPEGFFKKIQEGHGEQQVQRKAFKEILANKTFVTIVAQGVIGSLPWNAILFMVTWFEYIGFDPTTAGIMFVVIAIGAALGNFYGGVFGDMAARKSPKYGRIAVAQISAVMGIPLVWVIFILIPPVMASIYLYVIIGGVTGFLISWPSAAANLPIFTEIFEPEIRGTVYSVDRVFEGSFSAFGTIFVAWIASALGYITPGANITDFGALPYATHNAHVLAWGMFLMCVIPWIISSSIYTLVYIYYPKDFAKMRAILRARMQEKANGGST